MIIKPDYTVIPECIGYNANQFAEPALNMTPLPYLSVLKLSGDDVASFLQGQLAADVASLNPGDSTFAAYCSPRGQVIALLLVCRTGKEWLVLLESGLAEAVAARLRMFVLRAKVVIEHTHDLQAAGLFPGADAPTGARAFSPRQTSLRYLVTSPESGPAGASLAWRRNEVCAGVVWLERASSERFIPQMLGLDAIGAVSFSKGCYPGQEIVARTRYLGKVKRHPVVVQLEVGAQLRSGESCFVLGNGQEVEAVIVDVVCPPDPPCVAFLVAPLEKTDPVTAIRAGDLSWPALRL
jgi:tRNA-modifying protein YgfZ